LKCVQQVVLNISNGKTITGCNAQNTTQHILQFLHNSLKHPSFYFWLLQVTTGI